MPDGICPNCSAASSRPGDCSFCGLTAEAAEDILMIALERNGPALRAKAIAQRIQLDQAERELEQCKAILILARKHLDSFQPVAGLSGG